MKKRKVSVIGLKVKHYAEGVKHDQRNLCKATSNSAPQLSAYQTQPQLSERERSVEIQGFFSWQAVQ